MSDRIRLLAMTGAGDVFFADDGRGHIWLFDSMSDDDPVIVSEQEVDRAVADHGLVQVEQEFPSWDALDDFRRSRARLFLERFTPQRQDLTAADVRRGVQQVRRWINDNEQSRGRELALYLLRAEVVRADKELHSELLDLLKESVRPLLRIHRPQFDEELVRQGTQRMRDRWTKPVVAA
jgi:hypothetical protein